MPAAKGQNVRVNYRGTLQDGTEFDSSYGREPLEFTIGSGQVIPGFDEAVQSMDVGEKKTITIPPGEAYGEHHDEAVQQVPRSIFNQDEPTPGDVVTLVAPDGTEVMATVAEIGAEEVTLDFNHPLAGEPLTFELELVEVS
ncbi:MAG TPA: peptidylprolyl isomerase [Coriobacteriia bacterium]|jgi:FKBP-type peptidyl-prolyl cis-trans isomerase 2